MPEDVAQTGALCRSAAVTQANWNDLAVNQGELDTPQKSRRPAHHVGLRYRLGFNTALTYSPDCMFSKQFFQSGKPATRLMMRSRLIWPVAII